MFRTHAMRFMRLVLAAFGLLAGAATAIAQTSGPRLELPRYPLMANEQFRWEIPVKIVNTTPSGIYNDSVRVEIEDLDPGETRRPRRQSHVLNAVARILPSISAGDSGIFRYGGPALAEHARLYLRVYSHAGDGTRMESDGQVEVEPGLMSKRFGSQILDLGKDRVEYVLVPEVWPKGPSPALLILHGLGNHARQMLPVAWHLADVGYTVMLVSLPGYGLSSGPPDLGGPRALAAVGRALDVLRRSSNVDSTRVAVWGWSQGATVAALLAAKRGDLRAVVAQSGLYDLEAVAGAGSEETRRTLESEAGPREGWKRRSPLGSASKITAPILLLHGERDPVVPVAQAREMATRLEEAGRQVTFQRIPEAGHLIPITEVRKAAEEFLASHLSPRKK